MVLNKYLNKCHVPSVMKTRHRHDDEPQAPGLRGANQQGVEDQETLVLSVMD